MARRENSRGALRSGKCIIGCRACWARRTSVGRSDMVSRVFFAWVDGYTSGESKVPGETAAAAAKESDEKRGHLEFVPSLATAHPRQPRYQEKS